MYENIQANEEQELQDRGMDYWTPSPFVPQLGLFRKISGKVIQLEVGDVAVLMNGKRFYITGWDEVQGFVHATSMCEFKYLVSVPAESFGCYFAEV